VTVDLRRPLELERENNYVSPPRVILEWGRVILILLILMKTRMSNMHNLRGDVVGLGTAEVVSVCYYPDIVVGEAHGILGCVVQMA
jgi:hypothetical protein